MSILLINIWERACTMMLHSLAYEHLLHCFAPGETGMCCFDWHSRNGHVMWYFTLWQMSMCCFITLFSRRVHFLSLYVSTEYAAHCSTLGTRHLCSTSFSIIRQTTYVQMLPAPRKRMLLHWPMSAAYRLALREIRMRLSPTSSLTDEGTLMLP